MIKIRYSMRAFIKKDSGKVAVRVRWNSKQSEVTFITGLYAEEAKWDSDTQKAKKGTTHNVRKMSFTASEINSAIADFKQEIENCMDTYSLKNVVPTPDELKKIVNEHLGRNEKEVETNVAKKAKYAYVIAALYFKKGNTSACRQWCRETLKYNPSNGGAYLLQANCIARGAYGKSPKDVATSYYYCLASDYCNKAKAVDPSSAGKASRQAAAYAAHFYPKSEAFFAGIKAGQAVSCMGETTILRLR